MKTKSINQITEQFGRINHFAKSYWLRVAALELRIFTPDINPHKELWQY